VIEHPVSTTKPRNKPQIPMFAGTIKERETDAADRKACKTPT
jgi:hypothetical protein